MNEEKNAQLHATAKDCMKANNTKFVFITSGGDCFLVKDFSIMKNSLNESGDHLFGATEEIFAPVTTDQLNTMSTAEGQRMLALLEKGEQILPGSVDSALINQVSQTELLNAELTATLSEIEKAKAELAELKRQADEHDELTEDIRKLQLEKKDLQKAIEALKKKAGK